MFPCDEAIEWLVKHVDYEESMIRNSYGKLISSFNAFYIEMYDKIPKEELCLDKGWLTKFMIFPKELLKPWWTKRETFITQ